jgi:hypothetical protein
MRDKMGWLELAVTGETLGHCDAYKEAMTAFAKFSPWSFPGDQAGPVRTMGMKKHKGKGALNDRYVDQLGRVWRVSTTSESTHFDPIDASGELSTILKPIYIGEDQSGGMIPEQGIVKLLERYAPHQLLRRKIWVGAGPTLALEPLAAGRLLSKLTVISNMGVYSMNSAGRFSAKLADHVAGAVMHVLADYQGRIVIAEVKKRKGIFHTLHLVGRMAGYAAAGQPSKWNEEEAFNEYINRFRPPAEAAVRELIEHLFFNAPAPTWTFNVWPTERVG